MSEGNLTICNAENVVCLFLPVCTTSVVCLRIFATEIVYTRVCKCVGDRLKENRIKCHIMVLRHHEWQEHPHCLSGISSANLQNST